MFGLMVTLCVLCLSLHTNACKPQIRNELVSNETATESNATLSEFIESTTVEFKKVHDNYTKLVQEMEAMKHNFSRAYNEFQEMKIIYMKLAEEVQILKNQVEDDYDNPVVELTTSSTAVSNQTSSVDKDSCPIYYKLKCYLPLVNAKMTLDAAKNECAKLSGKLADIYDKTQFDMIVKNLRSYKYMKDEQSLTVRLGMSVDESTGEAFLSDGRPAPYYRWCPQYPLSYKLFNSVILNVARSPTEYMQYMQNTDARVYHYSLCEI